MSADLLVEIGCEDLPARFVLPLSRALGQMGSGLAARGVTSGEPRLFATPRRIAVLIPRVEERQAEQKLERKGPKLAVALKDGQPTPAGLGFARSCGVEFGALAQEDGQLVFRTTAPGRPTTELLPEVFAEAVKLMDAEVPKRMRWGGGDATFVRPVQWLLALLGTKVVPLQAFGLKAGRVTFGHRFHAPRPISLKSPAEYERRLRAAKVWADFSSRQAAIRAQVEAQARKLRGSARITDALLEEVTALVEWPVAITGRMEERFLALPPEVVIATIEHNQRYFPVFGRDGKLLPRFVTVANIVSRDVKQVVEGNERVVTPRLTDALFFWEQDRRRRLADFVPGLDRVTFQKDLGSIGDKARRIAALAGEIAGLLREDAAVVQRAAALCKADLVTRMVFEFPELQGVMGGAYAEGSGEPAEVARAIREHYQPAQSGAATPATRPGQIVALADKLDTLAGIFAVGQKPSANRDPFALRRAAIGALRICIERGLPLDLRALLERAVALQPAGRRDERTLAELWEFVLERLRSLTAEQGLPVETFNAVAATGTGTPLDFVARTQAVTEFLGQPESAQLAAAHKRVRNILKTAGDGGGPVAEALLQDPRERELFGALGRLSASVERAAATGEYAVGLKALAQLQKPVDAFFDHVMVMAPEPELRRNRVALLRQLDQLCRRIADLSCLPG